MIYYITFCYILLQKKVVNWYNMYDDITSIFSKHFRHFYFALIPLIKHICGTMYHLCNMYNIIIAYNEYLNYNNILYNAS